MELEVNIIISKYCNPLGVSFPKYFYSSFFKALKRLGYEQLFNYYSKDLNERTTLLSSVRKKLLEEVKKLHGIDLLESKEEDKYVCFIRNLILKFEINSSSDKKLYELKDIVFNNLKLYVRI